MNLAEYREQVKAYTDFEGSSHVVDDEGFNAWINRANDLFCVLTACLYSSFPVLTLSTTTQVLDLTKSCSPRVWLATGVVISGSPLLAIDGKPGPCTPHEMLQVGIYGNDKGKPKRWSREGAHSIVLDRVPDQGYGSCYAPGYTMPTHVENDEDDIGLPLEYHPIGAMFTAAMILDPRAAGGQLERVKRIDAKSGEYMAALMEQGKMTVRSVLGGIPIESSQEEAI
jgi:hypothetical protein